MPIDEVPKPLEYQRDEHRVFLMVFHLIWIPKRRKPVLTGPSARDCQGFIRQKCADKGWQVLELAVQPDHVHLFVRVWPSNSAADVVKECKGVTAHELRAKYPAVLRKLPSFWTRSYFASTAGQVSASTIAKYIASQRGM